MISLWFSLIPRILCFVHRFNPKIYLDIVKSVRLSRYRERKHRLFIRLTVCINMWFFDSSFAISNFTLTSCILRCTIQFNLFNFLFAGNGSHYSFSGSTSTPIIDFGKCRSIHWCWCHQKKSKKEERIG